MNVLHGEGNKATATPVIGSFNSIDIDIDLKVITNIQEGASSVKIDGYENLLGHIKTTVENNTLRIYSDLDETWEMESDDVVVTVTMPAIAALSISGTADADIHGKNTGRSFRLRVSGAGEVTIDNISTDTLSVHASGATDLTVKGGTVKFSRFHISGAGKISSFPLQSEETYVHISGAGTSQVTALHKLTADISGAGTIKYKGHPVITKDISGAGTIADAN